MRIASLLPSATEIVYALGLEDDLIGVTFECDYPEAARAKRVVSDTSLPAGLSPGEIDRIVNERAEAHASLYTLDEDALRTLDPELVLTQDLCSVCAIDVTEVSDALTHLGCRGDVLTLDPKRLDEVLRSIERVGAVTGTTSRAQSVVGALDARLAAVDAAVRGAPRPRTFVLEWTDPPFNAGHWIPDMVVAAGGEPILSHPGEYSTPLTWAQIVDAQPEIVVVAPCGYQLHGTTELIRDDVTLRGQLAHSTAANQVWAVDASSYFVRPGPRLVDGVEILAGILHPDRCAPPAADAARRVAVES
jgi:iron complex transport system substrate-binding protein